MAKNKFVVVDLGGSLLVPHHSDKGGVSVPFLRKFRECILEEVRRGARFVIVTGGGRTTRVFQKAASQVARVSNKDLDWIGIQPTRLNAHLLRAVFQGKAYPEIIDRDPSPVEVRRMKASSARFFVSSGWRPGWSTDYVAVRLAQRFKTKSVVIAGDVPFVYDQDPKKYRDAEPLTDLSWKEYRRLIPRAWRPGFSSPVDPVAARFAAEHGITVKILKGTDFANLKRAVRNKPFMGTVIS